MKGLIIAALLASSAQAITTNPASAVTADSDATPLTIPYRDANGNFNQVSGSFSGTLQVAGGASVTGAFAVGNGTFAVTNSKAFVGMTGSETLLGGGALYMKTTSSGSYNPTTFRQRAVGPGQQSYIAWDRFQGNESALSSVLASDYFGSLVGVGYDGTAMAHGPEITTYASTAWTTSDHGSAMKFLVVKPGTTAQIASLWLNLNGDGGANFPYGNVALGGTLEVTGASHLGGSVGIGTALPATTLDVNGNAQFGSGATKSTFTATGFWEPLSQTRAQINTLVPTKVGQVIYASDTTLPGLCISTGTLAAQWRKMESATLGCGTNN